jgi:hypothetical protein
MTMSVGPESCCFETIAGEVLGEHPAAPTATIKLSILNLIFETPIAPL